jgi:hypothetical protein
VSRNEVAAVHVWWQDDSDDGPEWVVSIVDSDGDEITCIGGYGGSLGDAWERACEEADARGVPALELDRVNGTTRDRYEPQSAAEEA